MTTAQFSESDKIIRRSEDVKNGNDLFRTTLIQSPSHRFCMTEGVASLSQEKPEFFAEVIGRLRAFKDFSEDNDPHGEHDFGRINHGPESFFFKIDYYDALYEYGADPYRDEKFSRVLTLMLAEEY